MRWCLHSKMVARSDVIKHWVAAIFKRVVDVNQRSVDKSQFNRHIACCRRWQRYHVHCVLYCTINKQET